MKSEKELNSEILRISMTILGKYPELKNGILKKGSFGDITFPRLLKVNDCVVVVPAIALIVLVLFWIEKAGF